jgi:hypothetical protein
MGLSGVLFDCYSFGSSARGRKKAGGVSACLITSVTIR